ncbi:MAG: MBL fold metallo-hydrolase [Parvibaculaceae bacterium]
MDGRINRRSFFAATGAAIATPFVLRGLPARAAAPAMGPARPNHYRFKLGGFEVTTLFDGSRAVKEPYKIFGQDQKPEDVQALAEQNMLPGDRMENMFSPVVVNTGSKLVVFDTGNGAGGRPDVGRFAAALKEAGYAPDQVDIVILTHFHPDHIGGLMEEGKPLFANAEYGANETEFSFWTDAARMSGPTERVAKVVEANVKPLAEKMTMLKDGAEVQPGIRAMVAPGHTPGHTAFLIESDGSRLLIGGDFCNHFVLSMQRPDWHVSFDMDKDQAAATRRKLLDMLATDRLMFTSYHMPFPAVGFVEKAGEGYRYAPASYQPFL